MDTAGGRGHLRGKGEVIEPLADGCRYAADDFGPLALLCPGARFAMAHHVRSSLVSFPAWTDDGYRKAHAAVSIHWCAVNSQSPSGHAARLCNLHRRNPCN